MRKSPGQKPAATRDDNSRRDAEGKQMESTPLKREAKPSGQIYCNSSGCRPVRPGCRLENFRSGVNVPANDAVGNTVEVCN